MRTELVSWSDVDKLIDHLLPQLPGGVDMMLAVNPTGLVLAGLLAEALGITSVELGAVVFPAASRTVVRDEARMAYWPEFRQFPDYASLTSRKVLIVDAAWSGGRVMSAIRSRLTAAGSQPSCAVLHFNTTRNHFQNSGPEYFAAVTDAYILYPWQTGKGRDKIPRQGISW